jgi:serine/threonine protein kinase
MNPSENQQPPTVVPPAAPGGPALDDPRVVAALEEYLAALEGGQKLNRQGFLARHADIAGALAECLDGMEALYGASSSPHQAAAEVAVANPSAEWQPGTALGDFRIVREIGRGGMGVVYEAEQLSLGRQIALKILPFALTLDPRQLQRFKNEARAAAHLHHTNIVPIYSVGCERGVHFYAMQFIDGQTLAEVIEELRQLPGAGPASGRRPPPTGRAAGGPAGVSTGPYGGLPAAVPLAGDTAVKPAAALTTARSTNSLLFFRNVAQLGVQAAEALEHAHEYGVVHRDIKPGNLLVDAHNHLWIADFGLAQFQTDAALTMTGDLLGTLRYMSPEQALAKRGLVDHRADIYSLGATLYELLTLEPIFDGPDRQELLRQIAFEEPRPPRRVNAAVPADLETIVLKAVAKGVEERYATARELAEDLRRFLETKPIQARRPTLVERAAKWARRHRAMVVTAAVALLLAAVGFATSTALIWQEQRKTQSAYDQLAAEQANTEKALGAEAEQRARAEKSFRQAWQAVDFFARVEEELADKPGLQGFRRKLLEAALEYYQDFIDEHGDDPSIQAELLDSHLRVATILKEIGSKAEADAALAKARQFEERILRDNRFGPPPGRGGRPWGPPPPWSPQDGGALALLGQKSIQEDLKLSREQLDKIGQLSRERRDAQREAHNLDVQEKALVESLPSAQSRRLKEIALQRRGVLALKDSEVADALSLTRDQLEKIRPLLDEIYRFRGGPDADSPKKREQAWKSATEQLLNVLTAEQKAKWSEMTGEPFKGEVFPGFGGPPGPGRNPRHPLP